MNTEFRFNSKTKQLILIPESTKDKMLLQMFTEETKEFVIRSDGDTYRVEPLDRAINIIPVAEEMLIHQSLTNAIANKRVNVEAQDYPGYPK
jgi:hypothetical protein